ncbi:MAG: nitroreductase family protein [Desulfuromonadales bacterium]|jgi:nitroreductase
MPLDRSLPRNPGAEVDSMFVDRWSPRAFKPGPLSKEQIDSLFEAARWAPSCFNEQPWLFVYAAQEADRQRLLSALVESNQVWAKQASLLIFLLCRRCFEKSGKENRHAPFDAGAAWMALALQARKLGLHAHAMAGFSREKAYPILQVSAEDYDIMAAIAVGYRTDPESLPETLAAKEKPNQRKPKATIARELAAGALS